MTLSEEINALPAHLRRYIHDLSARADPAGDVLALAAARENAEALGVRVVELQGELADVAYLDEAARRGGTRVLDPMPVELPGIDEDHIHFVLMPIGAVSRRAAVTWLKAHPLLHCHGCTDDMCPGCCDCTE